MTRLVNDREVNKIIDWATTVGYSVAVKGNKLLFTHAKIPQAICIGAVNKNHYDHPDALRRKLERAVENSGGGGRCSTGLENFLACAA